eukprot:TRINITY_DN15287_c0_g2_i1.p1 TRINITY_DN15287_c0_g2~~TRINITY_DN15287_c0_g2_i1.p1  ORF type:complete len:368 (+),score=135.64 TRINITY_DN15287_c0_g2_i1:36-1106(+)
MNVLLAGPGLIGGELLQQLAKAGPSLGIKVVGVANSKSFVLNKDGLDAASAKATLQEKGVSGSVEEFVKQGAALGLPKTVFVDCTASEAVSPAYALALEHNMHVCTANKKVNSGELAYRKKVLELAGKPAGPRFRYETNVGAGLPIIKPLIDMRKTGDKVLKIEAILSGTLAFLFNSFKEGVKFSEVVKQAKELGYTEPDPRDDLSGADVARKITILTREAGYDVELADVKIEPFLPESCFAAPSVEEFFKVLESEADAQMEARRAAAASRGEALRVIASLETDTTPPTMKLSLQEVSAQHAAYGISGSDNICIIKSERYNECPLVVKGPGAGAAVTAAGVFADILTVVDIDVTPA